MGAVSIYNNTALGNGALSSITTGNGNTATGFMAMSSNLTGQYSTAFGYNTLTGLTAGQDNTAFGSESMALLDNGYGNTAIGTYSYHNNSLGNYNTTLGSFADVAVPANPGDFLVNATAIGSNAVVEASHTIQLGDSQILGVKTSGTITAGTVTYPNSYGINGQVLTSAGSGTLSWATPASGVTSIGSISGSNANGGSIASGVLNLTAADGTNGGVVDEAAC